MTLKVFGLTGGLASGKSTVAARFRARGLPVIDADQLAREIVQPGRIALCEIVEQFGQEMLQQDGTLDRKALGSRAFADPASLRRLEAITHPRIAAAARSKADELAANGAPLACYEAALLVERRLVDSYRPLVVVSSAPELQIARACQRDHLTEPQARARLAAQLSLSHKVALADYVIVNDADLTTLKQRADDVLDAICRSEGIAPSRYGAPLTP